MVKTKEKVSAYQVHLANFALGRNTTVERLTEEDLIEAHKCWLKWRSWSKN